MCNQTLQMSQSHVPPQTCIEQDRRGRIASNFFAANGHKYTLQNGIHFYTLCKRCNDSKFSKYDKELGKFSRKLREATNSPVRKIKCKPNYIARSLIGAVLTSSGKNLDLAFKTLLQEYIENVSQELPKDLEIGFWIHPFDSASLQPDSWLIDKISNTPAMRRMLLIIKYYPIAWIISFKDDSNFYQIHNIRNFSQYASNAIGKERGILVDLEQEKPEMWPNGSESPVIFGQAACKQSIYAQVKSKN